MTSETYFESLLEIYRRPIEELLIPRALVPFLPDWDPDIFRMSDPKKFLKEFQNKLRAGTTDDASRMFTEFLDGLKAADYTLLYKLLSGEDCHEFDKFRRLLRVLQAYIKDKIVIDRPLLQALRNDDVISEEEKLEIQQLVDNSSRIEATYALMRALPRHHERWPVLFIKALRETGNENVVEVILIGETDEESSVLVADQERLLQKVRDMETGMESTTNQESLQDDQVENLNQRLDKKNAETAIKMPVNNLNSPNMVVVEEGSGSATFGPNVSIQSQPGHENKSSGATEAPASGSKGQEVAGPAGELGLKLRKYQMELAQAGLNGKNAIICAPTNSGKTFVALAIAKHHLEQAREEDRACVIYVVNKVNLVEQQLKVFKDRLPESYNPDGMSGGVDNQVGLVLKMSMSKVVFLTAQILLNALETDSTFNADVLSLSAVSLLIFDECQNTTKNHPYNSIMKHYLEAKLGKGPKSRLPQIIGLTASLGVGGAGSSDSAARHVEEMCANLDATELCVVKENGAELLEYLAEPDVDLKTVRGREHDPCKTKICQHMDEIHKEVRKLSHEVGTAAFIKHPSELPKDFGSQPYTNWVTTLAMRAPEVDDTDLRMKLMAYASYLKMYHGALTRNAEGRTKDALEYLAHEIEELKHSRADEVSDWLGKRFKEIDKHLRPIMEASVYENPLLTCLEKTIIDYSKNNSDDSRGIVFVKTKATAGMLHGWMTENDRMKAFKPAVILGTTEMTQVKQMEILGKFARGENRCLIATSVVEEGLDIPLCNWVIRYNHTTNEIALKQTKGRARQVNSRYAVIATEESGMVRKEKTNQLREILMDSVALEVSQMPKDVLEKRILAIQAAELTKHRGEAEERKSRPFVTNEYDLLCKTCRVFVTNSEDLRVRNKAHYTSIREGLEDIYVKVPVKESSKKRKRTEFDTGYDIHCKNERCNGQRWGRYANVSGIEMPIFSPGNFTFRRRGTDDHDPIVKRWKDFPYTIPEY